jgi:putative ABC transport system permease protein
MSMDSLFFDIRCAVRGLLKKPGFSLVAILTFALGIGANTSIFSIVYGVLLEPLGYANEGRLVAVTSTHAEEGYRSRGNYLPDFWFWREHARSFETLGFYGWRSMTLETPEQAQQIQSVAVSENLFRLLGLEPHLGRGFLPEDEVPGRGHVALASWGLWQRAFGGNPEIVGRSIRIDGQSVTLIGVMPSDTAVPSPRADLWLPVGYLERYERTEFGREERDFTVVGRLRTHVSQAQAQEEMDRLSATLAEMFPATNEKWNATLIPYRELLVGAAREPLWIAFAAVGLVLLIACANLLNLLLVRAVAQERETAVRTALGARRRRLFQQHLTESLVLAFLGGCLGWVLGAGLQRILLAFEPGILPRAYAIRFDLPALAFALGATLVLGTLLGLVTAARGIPDLAGALKQGGGHLGAGRRQNRTRVMLVGAEITMAMTLLVGAGMLIQALYTLSRVDAGFRPEGVYTAHVLLNQDSYGDLEARRRYFKRLVDEVRVMPGVETAALTTTPPAPNMGIQIEVPYRGQDGPLVTEPAAPRASFRVISPGYMETVGIPLLQGRDFTARDGAETPPVILINETLARHAWQSENPVGRQMSIFAYGERLSFEVIGIVGDTRFAGLHEPPRPALFLTHPQMPFRGMAITARSNLPPAQYGETLRRTVLSIDPSQPVMSVQSLVEELHQSLGVERFFAIVLGSFAAVALTLAAAGIYGVFAYWVSRRTREIGLRMALGARPAQVLALFVTRGMGITGASMLIGLVGALILSSAFSSAFHGVVLDPAVLFAAMVVLGGVAFVACLVPARQAARVEPTVALRFE